MFFDEQNLHSIDGDGELMLSILASFAQEESLSVSENCKWRIRKNFAEGKLASLRLYGYEFIHGKPVISISVTLRTVLRCLLHHFFGIAPAYLSA